MSPRRTTSPSTSTWLRRDTAEAGADAGSRAEPNTSENTARIMSGPPGRRGQAQLVQGLQHFVRRLDDLGVHLIGALRGDQVGDFLHRVDVRGLEEALQRRGEALLAGGPRDRVARGGGLQE